MAKACVYRDITGKELTKQEVHALSPESLQERSGIAVNCMPDTDVLYEKIADLMIEVIESRGEGKTTMILPVGPVGQYPVFARKAKEKRLDLSRLITFNMDEFLDRNGRTIPEDHPLSFKGIMETELVSKLDPGCGLSRDHMFFPRHDNLEDIDRTLDEHAPDGVDLCLAGVGPEGHFAFNENPNFNHVQVEDDEFLGDRTRLVMVNTSTVDMDALVASSGDRSEISPYAVTLGPRDIMRAKRMEIIFFCGPFSKVRAAGNLVSRTHLPFSWKLAQTAEMSRWRTSRSRFTRLVHRDRS